MKNTIKEIIRKKKVRKLQGEIDSYCITNPCNIYFDYTDELSERQIKMIVENGYDGITSFYEELMEYNTEYMFQLEDELKINVKNDFYEEIKSILLLDDFNSSLDDDLFVDFLNDEIEIYPNFDFDLNHFLNQEIIASVVFYSNYDCTCSTDTITEKETYLHEIYKVVNKGIKKKDYLKEHSEVYGGSLLNIPFAISINDFVELKEKMKTACSITIDKDTVFGFLCNHLGSCTAFDQTTYRKMTIPINYGESEYDHISIVADIENYYGFTDIAGYRADSFDSNCIAVN